MAEHVCAVCASLTAGGLPTGKEKLARTISNVVAFLAFTVARSPSLRRLEARNDPQRVLALDRRQIGASEDGAEPLHVLKPGPIRIVGPIDDLRDRHELGERGDRPRGRGLASDVGAAVGLAVE